MAASVELDTDGEGLAAGAVAATVGFSPHACHQPLATPLM
jgi:hypothetical protein